MASEATSSARSTAAPAAVWRVLTDGPRWAEWNSGVEWLWIESELAAGQLATVKPKRIRQTAFLIDAVVPERHLAFRLTVGPVAALCVAFTLEPDGEGTFIEATVSTSGIASGFLFEKSAAKIAAAMPANLERLAERATLAPPA